MLVCFSVSHKHFIEIAFSESTSSDSGIGEDLSPPWDNSLHKNSLSHLCRRFLMVLLASSEQDVPRRVSLDVASTILIKDTHELGNEPPSRSESVCLKVSFKAFSTTGRCRRLYDIANVLIALKIINKVNYMFGTKKIPLFVYCGPTPSGAFLLEALIKSFLFSVH